MEDDSTPERSSGSLQAASARNSSSNEYKKTVMYDADRPSSSDTMEMAEMLSDEELDDDEETGLTEAQRQKRTQRKEQSARLDSQISGVETITDVGGSIGNPDDKLVNATMMKNIIINTLLIVLWYSFSIAISVYNKWMFSKENLDFHYPLFTTSLHMIVQFILASSVIYFMPRFRPGANASVDPHDPSYTRLDGAENENETATERKPTSEPLMTKWFYISRIGPCGSATALDIGLGNFSLRFISLTFFTMCKSSVLAFVLLFAFLFHLEHPTWKLCVIILFMTVGVIMMVAGETAFNALGFVLVMIASLCSGFRWSLTQILLLRNRATSNPFSSIFFLTPIMFVALFALALPIEGPKNVVTGVKELASAKGGFFSFVLLLFPGLLAFLMVSAEFALLKRTSVVTLSVCGIFKEVLTISAAGIVFGDELSPINVSGLVVTIASIAAYNYLKYTKMKQEAIKEAKEIEAMEAEDSADAIVDGQKQGIASGAADDEARLDSTSALMNSSLHSTSEGNHDAQHSSKANGVVIEGAGKRPDGLE